MWKSQGERSGLHGGCWSVSKPNLWKLILHQTGSMGMGVIIQNDDSVRQHSRTFWFCGASQCPQPLRNDPHFSAVVCLPPFPMLDEHTLILRSHPEQWRNNCVDLCIFSTHVSYPTSMEVSIRNNSVVSFCEEYVLWRVFCFHLTALLDYELDTEHIIETSSMYQLFEWIVWNLINFQTLCS